MKTKLTFISKADEWVIVKVFETPLDEMIKRIASVITRGDKELYEIEPGRYMWNLATGFHIFESA